MKKCKVCGKPNPTKDSTCSVACKIENIRANTAKRRAKQADAKANGETPKKRAKTLKKTLKEEAWRLFSEYIRRKDADNNGMVACVTCGTVKHWKEMQAGHAVGGRGGYVLFLEEIVRAQCYGCNCGQKGKYPEFADKLINIEKTITPERYFEIVRESHMPHKMKEEDYEKEIEKYTKLLQGLKQA